MSMYHENVVWQSPDKTWNIGFHPEEPLWCDDDCDDDTHEWCREFDSSEFFWVSAGHTTPEQAMAAWDGANPGAHTIVHYDASNPDLVERVAEYEDMAAVRCEKAQRDAAQERAKGRIGFVYGDGHTYSTTSPGYWGYRGPAKQRTLASLARERNDVERSLFSRPLSGSDDEPDTTELKDLQARIDSLLKTATPEEKQTYLVTQKERRDALAKVLADADAADAARVYRNQRSASWRPYAGYSYAQTERARRQAEARRSGKSAIEAKIAEVEALIAKQSAPPAKKAAAEPTPKKAAAKPAPKKTAAKPTARGKTTAKSTAGSFKAPVKPEATGVDLGTGMPDVDHLWG